MQTFTQVLSALFPVLIFLSIAFGRDAMDMLHRRQISRLSQATPGRVDRLRALEFIAEHPQLRTLADAEALTVAGVLQEVLARQERKGRRFQLVVAVASLAAGAAITAAFG